MSAAIVGVAALAGLATSSDAAVRTARIIEAPVALVAAPDFGPNVTIFDPSMSVADINAQLKALSTKSTGFDENHFAVYFMPGTYGSAAGADNPATATNFIDSPVGFMTTVQGLGGSPDDVTINGNLRVGTAGGGALSTFWRSLGNLKINPIQTDEPAHTLRWNTSQSNPLRRLHLLGNLDMIGGRGAGNNMSNSVIAGSVDTGMMWQQDRTPPVTGTVVQGQYAYYVRDSVVGSWLGRGQSFTFSGVTGAPPAVFNPGDKTVLATTPTSRDPAFLYYANNAYSVFVPSVRSNVAGNHWGMAASDGVSIPIQNFYIAKPTDTAAAINAALASGSHLIITPGVYRVDQAIHVTNPNTVVMGMGLSTIVPTQGNAAIQIDDVPGVMVSGLTIDANTVRSDVLVQVGTPGSYHGMPSNPTTLSDIFVRVGGQFAGKATTSIELNQSYTLMDGNWIWRADHGNAGTVGWLINQGDHGLVVNGDNITMLGSYIEHYQKSQVVWNGNGGTTLFLYCEPPYDPPVQKVWMNGADRGYPCYEVGSNVSSHEAAGIISNSFFQAAAPASIYMHAAVKAPIAPFVRFTNTTAGIIRGIGGIEHIVNETGGPIDSNSPAGLFVPTTAYGQLTSYPF